MNAWIITFQTLDSDELVPLAADLSDLIRTLSDLCIQAYQQLLSITEKRLQNIIGTTIMKTTLILLMLPPLMLPPAPSFPQSLLCWRARPSQVCLDRQLSWERLESEQVLTPGL